MNRLFLYKTIQYCLAFLWLMNGLYCKILNKVNRHELIVARVTGNEYSFYLTKAIGFAEILLSIWIVTSINKKLCALFQIICILSMNIIEYFIAKDLLLFGGYNLLLAIGLSLVIYLNEFVLNNKNQ